MEARGSLTKGLRTIFGGLLAFVSVTSIAITDVRLNEALALLEAEIQVRDYHLLHTSNIDEELTLKKIRDLEAQKNRLEKQLSVQQQQVATDTFNSEKERLKEIFSFSNNISYTCLLEQPPDNCLNDAIRSILNQVILAFSDNAYEASLLPNTLPESGQLVLSPNQEIKYESTYDVAFSDEGLLTYELKVEGELAIAPSDEELIELENSIFQSIKKESHAEIQQLVSQYKISLMKEDSLIEKKKKKKRIFGSF
ncbi:hypothetical protein [Alteromonas sp. ASW11-130]|uniref:hypothetical protein n=1 Tax=Alteromonas sp. ASW11-130 TaxID=3015775 RepID=UPI002242783B|nr:hypothetical protein [Alteromonas sp. ASW11-130]MCW8090301.1 hypothetical protein [Alteromonas sp. ASW11-130]